MFSTASEWTMSFSRRVFLRWTAFFSAALAVTRRNAAAHPWSSTQPATQAAVLPGLDATALGPLAHAVLPAELGLARIERETLAFAKWIAGYREGEELLHPYGSERLGKTGPSPAAKWIEQLRALSTAAETTHKRPFATLTVEQRAALVQQALAGIQFNARVPAPIAAPHVALGLLAHFLESPDATNLAYNRIIDPKQCRPLANSPKEPVSLQRGGRA